MVNDVSGDSLACGCIGLFGESTLPPRLLSENLACGRGFNSGVWRRSIALVAMLPTGETMVFRHEFA